jgi:hypothetical protein
MKSDPPNPSEPFPRERIPPEIVEWARQTFDEEEFLAHVREIEATGGPARRLHRRNRSASQGQVSTAASGPEPYRVVYSKRVRQRLLALADVARGAATVRHFSGP